MVLVFLQQLLKNSKKKIEDAYSPENLESFKDDKLLEKKAIEKFNTLSEALNFLDVFPEHKHVFDCIKEDLF